MEESKQEIRQQILNKRVTLDKEYILEASKVIQTKLIEYIDEHKHCEKVLLYKEFKNEVIISIIADQLKNKDIEIFFPFYFTRTWVIKSSKTGEIFSTPQQASFTAKDLVVVPGIAFTKKGERIGFGNGTYDKWLSAIESTPIGIGYDFQMFKSLPQDGFDVKMKTVLTNV